MSIGVLVACKPSLRVLVMSERLDVSSYERVHPVVNGTVVQTPTGSPLTYTKPPAPVHVVIGSSGALQFDFFVSPSPAWSAYRAADQTSSYGWGQLTAHNSTHLQLFFASLNGEPGDEFWIAK